MLWISFTKQDRLASGRLSRTSSLKRWFYFLKVSSWDFQAWQLAKVALGQKTQVRRREDCARWKVISGQYNKILNEDAPNLIKDEYVIKI
ncbi:MAG: hypothetical protein DYG98_27115 [Haliscomenobacteraceae bacterium CHB4]|nr:hypothetical protein [Haliscomenobacteraceae bacterium CHB4]